MKFSSFKTKKKHTHTHSQNNDQHEIMCLFKIIIIIKTKQKLSTYLPIMINNDNEKKINNAQVKKDIYTRNQTQLNNKFR